MFKPLLTATVGLLVVAACTDTPTQPEAAPRAAVTSYDVAHSENPMSAILTRVDGACGVFLDPELSDVSNYDGKFYQTVTSSGVVNLNCTGATLREDQIPARTYSFKWEFSGQVCFNRITRGGKAHANCHLKVD